MNKLAKFWRIRIRIRIRITTLVRLRALAEVCTVPVLLVLYVFIVSENCMLFNVFVCDVRMREKPLGRQTFG